MSKKLTDVEKKTRAARRLGCSHDEYVMLKPMKPSPIKAFTDQRNNAKRRGISWEMNLSQWWSVWQDSCHWSKRGTDTNSYCMSRKGDVGSYSIDNVFIALFRQNSSDKPQKTSGLPIGVFKKPKGNRFHAKRKIKGKDVYLGCYLTIEQAAAAYLASVSCE